MAVHSNKVESTPTSVKEPDEAIKETGSYIGIIVQCDKEISPLNADNYYGQGDWNQPWTAGGAMSCNGDSIRNFSRHEYYRHLLGSSTAHFTCYALLSLYKPV